MRRAVARASRSTPSMIEELRRVCQGSPTWRPDARVGDAVREQPDPSGPDEGAEPGADDRVAEPQVSVC
jgi:hypothetical protein